MEKIIRGFKIFDNNLSCRGMKYEIGKEYTIDDRIAICFKGFHFCKRLIDVFNFRFMCEWNRIAEVEGSGEIIEDPNYSKVCCSKIKIIRELTWQEVKDIIKNETQEKSNLECLLNKYTDRSKVIINCSAIYDSHFVINSFSVRNSRHIDTSNGVYTSYNIAESNATSLSRTIYRSSGISLSNGVNNGKAIYRGTGILNSNAVNKSEMITNSNGISLSKGILNSNGINNSIGVENSNGISNSIGIKNCNGVSNALFCSNLPQKYYIFNKEVSKKRFLEVYEKINRYLFKYYPQSNDSKELLSKAKVWNKVSVLDIQSNVSLNWKDAPLALINFLTTLPEFNPKILYEITGIRKYKKSKKSNKKKKQKSL